MIPSRQFGSSQRQDDRSNYAYYRKWQNAPSVPGPSNPVDQSERPGRRPNVYVVHHDGGRTPVTVYTEEGAAFHDSELPSQYAADSTSTPPKNDASREVDRRESGAAPQKIQFEEPSSS